MPVLLYHHIVEGDNAEYSDSIISAGLFEKHLAALKEAGYQTVSLKQLEDYVYKGAELPDNPICITFDDGYYSNYEYAFPLLEKYDAEAVFVDEDKNVYVTSGLMDKFELMKDGYTVNEA